KVNTVVKRGLNDDSIEDMATHFRGSGHILRFIEYMNAGPTNGRRLADVAPATAIIEPIHAGSLLAPPDSNYVGEVAQRWRYKDGAGELGVIASVTQAFCATCTRARLSAEGSLYTCLFATRGTDLRALLRSGATDEEIGAAIDAVWASRADRYSEIRSSNTVGLPKVEMSYIGG